MSRRIFPDHVTIYSYVVPRGFKDHGRTLYVVSISDKRYSRELFGSFDHSAAVRFAQRSAARRRIPVVDETTKERS